MDDKQTEDVISNWYTLGEKLRTSSEPKIICEPGEGEDRRFLRVYYRNSGNPLWYKNATREAFEGLKSKLLVEEGSFGRGSKKLMGWVLNSAGRRRIGKFDADGKQYARHVNNDHVITSRVLPMSGTPRTCSRLSRAQPSRAKPT